MAGDRRHATAGGPWASVLTSCRPRDSEQLPTSKRLWKNGEELRSLEAFALAKDRDAALSSIQTDGQASVQRDVFKAMVALQSGRLWEAEATLEELAKRAASSADRELKAEWRQWEVVLKELEMQASLKAWGDAGRRGDIVRKLSQALGLDMEHQQDPAYKRRAEAAAGDPGPQYPSYLSAEAKAGMLSGLVERSLQKDSGMPSTSVLKAVLSSSAVMAHLMSRDPQRMLGLLHHAFKRPDARSIVTSPGLASQVASSLEEDGLPFGVLDFHRALTLDQMRELITLHPPVLGMAPFLAQLAEMLHDEACGSNPEPTTKERAAFLNALLEILAAAPESANWLRAQCFCSLLRLDREVTGWACPDILDVLLRLPRLMPPWKSSEPWARHGGSRMLEHVIQCEEQSPDCDMVQPLTNLPGLSSGDFGMEELKAWMMDAVMAPGGSPDHFATGSGKLAGILDTEEERRLVATAMLLSGKGDISDWTAALKAAGGNPRGLAASTHLRFSPDCRRKFMPGEAVAIKVDVKNCKSIAVKVFEVNAWNYCVKNLENVRADIELEGLGATHSFTVSLADVPAIQEQRGLEVTIPQLAKRRGVFVVELLGSGRACRALLRIGRLSAVHDLCPSGHSFRLLWEDGVPVDKPKVWIDSAVYTPDKDSAGSVIIPFSAVNHRRRQAVLGCQDGDMAEVMDFEHRTEEYTLEAKMFMEKESLVPQAQAPLLVWASLRLHGVALPISRLANACLFVSVVDSEGTRSEQKFAVDTGNKEGALLELRETIGMPEDPVLIEARLEGTVHAMSKADLQTGEPEAQALVAAESWDLCASEPTALHGIYLSRLDGGYILSVKGRAGEPVEGAVLKVSLLADDLVRAADYNAVGSLTHATLQTNRDGEAELGDLAGFSNVRVELTSTPSRGPTSPGNVESSVFSGQAPRTPRSCVQKFQLAPLRPAGDPARVSRVNIQANRSKPVRIPRTADPPVRITVFGEPLYCSSEPSLHQLPASGRIYNAQKLATLKDMSRECLSTEPGYVLLQNVPPGTFQLCLPGEPPVEVHSIKVPDSAVTVSWPDSARVWLMSTDRIAAASNDHPLQICEVSASAYRGIRVQLGGSEAALQAASVSICLTRFVQPSMNGSSAPAPLFSSEGTGPFHAGLGSAPEQLGLPPPSDGELVPERMLSEEVQYVLERRQALAESPACPGSVLQPPSLLVHPQQRSNSWSNSRALEKVVRRSCETTGCPLMARACAAERECAARKCGYGERGHPADQAATRCLLSFVPMPVLLSGLKPGPYGEVYVSAAELAAIGADLGASGHTIAAVRAMSASHGASSAWTEIRFASGPARAPVVPTCPTRPFKPGSCCVETQRVEALRPGDVANVADPGNLRIRVLDSLPKVWDHLGSLVSNPGSSGLFSHLQRETSESWRKLDFIARWPGLAKAQKLKFLAENPCHELHFYVAVNDTGLFKRAVQPLIAAKHPLERCFMDEWLLLCPTALSCLQESVGLAAAKAMVDRWGAPERLAELNTAERILLALLADGLALLEGGRQRQAVELRDLARRYATRTSNERALEQHRMSERRRFAAALRAGGDAPDGIPGGPPAAPPPPAPASAPLNPHSAFNYFRRLSPPKAKVAPRAQGFSSDDGCESFMEDELDFDEDEISEESFEMVEKESAEEKEGEADDGPEEDPQGADRLVSDSVAPGAGDGDDWLVEALVSNKRAGPRRFQTPGHTKKWFEGGWHESRIGLPRGASPHIPANTFWADVALQMAERLEAAVAGGDPMLIGRPMVPSSVLDVLCDHAPASSKRPSVLAAALLAVSFMAVPERPGCSVDRDPQTRALTIRAETPGLALIQEMLVTPSPATEGAAGSGSGLTIIRRLCEEDNGEMEKVEGPLEAGRLYRYEVIISSALPGPLALDILVTTPQGSVPEDAKPSKGAVPIRLNPYGSHMVQVGFYFPYPVKEAGQYPVTAASPEGTLLAVSRDEPPLEVVSRLPPKPPATNAGKFDWMELSQGGTDQEVLDFLETGNISEEGVDLKRVAWRARERPAFLAGALAALRRRRVFDRQLWQYALVHRQEDATREALSMFPELGHLVGPCFDSPVLTVDPRGSGVFHMELWPLINPRAHPIPEQALDRVLQANGGPACTQAFNSDLEQAWGSLLSVIARRPGGPSADEAVSAAYYLVLQERLPLARAVLALAAGEAAPGPMEMQREYMSAWLALREPGPGPDFAQLQAAWDSCKRYLEPSAAAAANPRWRRRWEELAQTLLVVRGAGSSTAAAAHLGAAVGLSSLCSAPSLAARPLSGWSLEVVAECLQDPEIQVKVFPMDAEVLFSTSPFSIADQGAEGSCGLGKFSVVAPAATMKIPTPKSSDPVTIDISGLLSNMEESGAVMVQLAAADASCSVAVYSGSLRVKGSAREGLLYVSRLSSDTDTWAPAPAAYCKVYAKDRGGSERFYKDGYTDVLGRFDYASLSGPPGSQPRISEMAVLVVLPHAGCVITKLDPPPGLV